jgi:predicted anti-sigma-YlaC factor YlaD
VQNQPQPHQHDHQGQYDQQAQQGQYDQQGQQGQAHADAQTDDTGIVLSQSVARLGALTAAGYLAGAYVGIAPLGVAVLAWTLLEMEFSE